MKRVIFAAALLAALHTFAASPAATQQWVKNYVSTNTTKTTSATVVSDTITDEGGTNWTFSLTIYRATEPAWRITESTVTGMPVGVDFAVDGYGNACNYTNTACNVIYQTTDTNLWKYIYNHSTNYLNFTKLSFQIDGSWYWGWVHPRLQTCTAVQSNGTKYVSFVRSYVTAPTKTKLITPPTTTSWLGLFFGTAYADWQLGEVIEDTEKGTWKQHYYWNDINNTIEIPSLSADSPSAGGFHYAFELNIVHNVYDVGGEYCEMAKQFNEAGWTTETYTQEIVARIGDEIKSKITDARLRYVFNRLYANGEFDQQIKDAVDPIFTAFFRSPECPREGTIDEDEEPGESSTPPSGTCDHPRVVAAPNVYGCRYKCRQCGEYILNGSHSFEDTADHCAVCDKTYKDVTCGYHSPRRSDHHFSTQFGGTADGCRCEHDRIWVPHENLVTNYNEWCIDNTYHWRNVSCSTCGWDEGVANDELHRYWFKERTYYYNDYEHVISNICDRCGYSVIKNMEDHYFATTNYAYSSIVVDMHSAIGYCPECKHLVLIGFFDHRPSGISKVDCLNENYHVISNWCRDCNHYYLASISNHVASTAEVYAPQYEYLGNNYHQPKRICAADGCGYYLPYGGPEACTSGTGWILSSSLSGTDTVSCVHCTNRLARAHKWSFLTEAQCWCVNAIGANGTGHLPTAHNFVNNVCTRCGYNSSTKEVEPIEDPEETVYCSCCSGGAEVNRCYAVYQSGTVKRTHCASGWDPANRRCGCFMCKTGVSVSGACQCAWAGIFCGPNPTGPISGTSN